MRRGDAVTAVWGAGWAWCRSVRAPGAAGRLAAAGIVCATCCALVTAGCGSTVPPREDVTGEKKSGAPVLPDLGWECEVVQGAADGWQVESLHGWKRDGASLVSVRGSTWGPATAGFRGHRTRAEAETEAFSSVVDAGLEALERRGVEFEPERRLEIIREARSALLEGREPEIPRVRVAGEVVERCRQRAGGETSWRVRVRAEYPIGRLRGDVKNVNWARSRLEREAGVVLASARSYFDDGRWFDGVRELARAREILREIADPAGGETERLAGEIDAVAREVLSTVAIAPLAGVEVLEAGAPSDAVFEFACEYVWSDVRRPARGAPVLFEPAGWSPVLDLDSPADRNGIVRVAVRTAVGDVGEAAVVARLDEHVMRAVGEGLPGLERGLERRGTQSVFLVESITTESVCLEVFGASAGATATFLVACERRLERGGLAVASCGPDVAVVVRVDLAVASSEESTDAWSAGVVASVSAFDQRNDAGLGETTIELTELAGTREEAETLTLKEAGRLVATYLDRRIVANRHLAEP